VLTSLAFCFPFPFAFSIIFSSPHPTSPGIDLTLMLSLSLKAGILHGLRQLLLISDPPISIFGGWRHGPAPLVLLGLAWVKI